MPSKIKVGDSVNFKSIAAGTHFLPGGTGKGVVTHIDDRYEWRPGRFTVLISVKDGHDETYRVNADFVKLP